jgi:hypothetical protein
MTLPIWTVYKHPLDYPGKFVARCWDLDQPTGVVIVGDTLEWVRQRLPSGLHRMERNDADDPVIVEVWI